MTAFWEAFLAEGRRAAPEPEPDRAPPEVSSSPWEADLLCSRRNTDPLACSNTYNILIMNQETQFSTIIALGGKTADRVRFDP